MKKLIVIFLLIFTLLFFGCGTALENDYSDGLPPATDHTPPFLADTSPTPPTTNNGTEDEDNDQVEDEESKRKKYYIVSKVDGLRVAPLIPFSCSIIIFKHH